MGRQRRAISDLKPKDLIGIPWTLALALRDDGWYLRDAIVWNKAEVNEDGELEGSSMPGSQRDRCTSAYEMVFMLTKKSRYYYDGDGCKAKSGAMLRNVWRINPDPTSIRHFSTYPRELVRRCVLLGTSARGVCPRSGAPWRREMERFSGKSWHDHENDARHGNRPQTEGSGRQVDRINGSPYAAGYFAPKTLGWSPSCFCPSCEPVPATVLDPFVGSGTTIVVANALGRRGVGLDLSGEYLGQATRRITRPHARPVRAERSEDHPLFTRLDDL